MGREEQVEEREVLDSIFPEEITGEQPLCPVRAFYYPAIHGSQSQPFFNPLTQAMPSSRYQ